MCVCVCVCVYVETKSLISQPTRQPANPPASQPTRQPANPPASQPTKLGPVFFIRKTYLFHRSGGDPGGDVSFKRRVLQQV